MFSQYSVKHLTLLMKHLSLNFIVTLYNHDTLLTIANKLFQDP